MGLRLFDCIPVLTRPPQIERKAYYQDAWATIFHEMDASAISAALALFAACEAGDG